MGISYDKLDAKLKARVDAADARDANAKPKRVEQPALVETARYQASMVDIAGPLRVRITRRGPGRLDSHDNLAGGCKSLVDAITAALGRTDDSERGRLSWEYKQERSKAWETVVEVWRDCQ